MRGHVDIAALLANIHLSKEKGPLEFRIIRATEPHINSLDLLAKMEGPTAAGWLLFKHRASLRKTGSVDFQAPVGAQLPPYFRVAMAHLKTRKKSWILTEVTSGGKHAYRVTWKHWQRYHFDRRREFAKARAR